MKFLGNVDNKLDVEVLHYYWIFAGYLLEDE
jgi:hypothetical protein